LPLVYSKIRNEVMFYFKYTYKIKEYR